jgi:hypothetical protein
MTRVRSVKHWLTLALTLYGLATQALAHESGRKLPAAPLPAGTAAAIFLLALLLGAGAAWGWRGARPALRARIRQSSAALVVALLLWVLPEFSLHQTHHALEHGRPDCAVQIIASLCGSLAIQATPALGVLSVVIVVLPTAIPPVGALSLPSETARSPPDPPPQRPS